MLVQNLYKREERHYNDYEFSVIKSERVLCIEWWSTWDYGKSNVVVKKQVHSYNHHHECKEER
jgi:hypothetical protein